MQKFCIFLFILIFSLPSRGNRPQVPDWCEETLNAMTLDEKIGQLFMVAVYSNKDKEYQEKIEGIIRKYHVGGLIFFQGDPVRQVEMVNACQKISKYPLLIGIDAEHGLGWRLQTAMEFPQMLINGAVTNDSLIYRLGRAIALHCKETGVHVNFAPVADVNNNPANPIIGMRSFGENPDNVYRKTAMYVAGSLSAQVLPVVKHFPGHGDTDTDSHLSLPVISHSLERLDSVELYPFRKLIGDSLPAIMVAHLNVKALDSAQIPATLSPRIVRYWLHDRFGFKGLCFTDAMNMKGVSQGHEKGNAEVKALLAGNDILLFPENIDRAVSQIKKAVKDSLISSEEIEARCRRILNAKRQYVLADLQPLPTGQLWSRLNRPEDFALKQELYKNAITLIKNEAAILPLKRLDTLKIASLNFGAEEINTFQTTLDKYARVRHFVSPKKLSDDAIQKLVRKLAPYNCIILYNNSASNRMARHYGHSPELSQLITRLKGKKVILCHPAIPYGLKSYVNLPIDAILVSYEDHLYPRTYAAQAIFGGIPVTGQLPVSITPDFPAGTSIPTEKIRLGYVLPEMCGVSTPLLASIDSICEAAIRIKSTPGCQVLVAKDNYIIYNKAFGHNTYEKEKANHISNIYDIASVTKIAATLPVVMKLYDQGRIAIDTPACRYYPPLMGSNKEDITLREILAHNAGLKSFFPAFSDPIDTEKLPGPLFTKAPTKHNTQKLKDHLFAYPGYQFKDSTLSRTPRPGFQAFTPGLYMFTGYRDSVMAKIIRSEVNPKKEYTYSDLGFIFLQKIAEHQTDSSLDVLAKSWFYDKLGACHTDFLAEKRLSGDYIVPSCIDKLYRKKEIKGCVHDPMAALLGGIAGHAGLFSTAEDLAKIMTLYLNKGTYGGEQLLSPATLELFTRKTDCFPNNRRGLGFDKPEMDEKKIGPTCKEAPASSYGHTGFTGTMAWVDPENRLVYIFLSNRTYPNEFNTKLSDENIRTKIQSAIYRALKGNRN
ncbi:MAG: serine hydrolase [Oscillibacter sp.]|nr:serine hydrolase [Oscillibacter sp.]